jgi:hypothetical protein
MTAAQNRPGAVFDCNICLQAIGFEHGPAAAALRLAEQGQFELFISKATLRE